MKRQHTRMLSTDPGPSDHSRDVRRRELAGHSASDSPAPPQGIRVHPGSGSSTAPTPPPPIPPLLFHGCTLIFVEATWKPDSLHRHRTAVAARGAETITSSDNPCDLLVIPDRNDEASRGQGARLHYGFLTRTPRHRYTNFRHVSSSWLSECCVNGCLGPIQDPMGKPSIRFPARENDQMWKLPLTTNDEDYKHIRLLLRLLDDQSPEGFDSSYTAMMASLAYYCESLSMPGHLVTSYYRLFQDIYHCPGVYKVERKRLRPIDKRHLDEVMSGAIEELAVLQGVHGDRQRADQEADGFDVERDSSTRAAQIGDEALGGSRTRAHAPGSLADGAFDDLVDALQGSGPIDTISPVHMGMIVSHNGCNSHIIQAVRSSSNVPPSGRSVLGVDHLVFQRALDTDLQTEEGLVKRFGVGPGAFDPRTLIVVTTVAKHDDVYLLSADIGKQCATICYAHAPNASDLSTILWLQDVCATLIATILEEAGITAMRDLAVSNFSADVVDREDQLCCLIDLWERLGIVRQTATLSQGELYRVFDISRMMGSINRTARRQFLATRIALMRQTDAPQNPHT